MPRIGILLASVAALLSGAARATPQSLPSGDPSLPEEVRFYHLDSLGSVRAVSDMGGTVVARYDYLPFGEQTPASLAGRDSFGGYTEDTGNKHRFTGKERDLESGLDYFGARYFSAPQGRFTSTDPGNAGAHPLNPQSWNGYTYVLNNPLKYVDPDGESATLVGGLVGGIFGGAGALIRGAITGSMPSRLQVLAAAAGGAVYGGMMGSVVDTGGLSLPAVLAAGALSGAASVATQNAVLGEGTSVQQLAEGSAGGMATAPLVSLRGPTVLGPLDREAAAPTDLKGLAAEVREAGLHPAAQNQRTIAVGTNSTGELFAGSSNGFDRGQTAAAQQLGIRLVPSFRGLHAEENLLKGAPGLNRVGTSVRPPCGGSEHNCSLQLQQAGVSVQH